MNALPNVKKWVTLTRKLEVSNAPNKRQLLSCDLLIPTTDLYATRQVLTLHQRTLN